MDDSVARLADELERRGLSGPTSLLLSAHRPLLPLLQQAGIALWPLARPFLGTRTAELDRVLRDPAVADRLLGRLAGGAGEEGDEDA